jgi:hypothetical protein
MSTQAEQAFPDVDDFDGSREVEREAFDMGAESALRHAADSIVREYGDADDKFLLSSGDTGITVVSQADYNRGKRGIPLVDWLRKMADEWKDN